MRVCPWYNDSKRATKCLIRQLERRWRTTGLECDRLAYCLQRQLVVSSIHRAKLKYHMSQIADASVDQKNCLRLSPSSYTPIMTLHFQHVTYSMRL